ncbi:MAG: flagellar hook protein FlgE [Bdellovibrionota bacterium]
MPSIVDGLFAGRAGIQSQGTGIAVLADNISNSNTTGFKQSRADFADLLAGNLSGGQAVVTGSGSSVNSITPILTQGTFEFTGRGLDTAIDGNGFFIVQDAASGQRFYSRAGNFKIDTQGNLLNQNGFQVMGFPSNGAGGLQALNVNTRSQSSVQTNEVTIGGNLNASSLQATSPQTTVGGQATFNALSTAANFSTFVNAFDSLGGQHTITMYYFRQPSTATGPVWTVQAYADSNEITNGTPGSGTLIGQFDMQFDQSGNRTTTPTSATPDFTASNIAWNSGAAPGNIRFLMAPYTQFASSSAVANISQDGTGSGNVVGFSVEPSGSLFAQLDNGQTASVGTIALATFANSEGLRRSGGSVFSETTSSGAPVVGQPGTGTFGNLQSGALELSNSDIAADFIKLISLQRGFQGSSRIITNINDLLNEVINLAR